MLSLFQRKRVPLAAAAAPPPVEPAKGLTPPQSATSLLAEPHRRRLLEHIWLRTALSRRAIVAALRRSVASRSDASSTRYRVRVPT